MTKSLLLAWCVYNGKGSNSLPLKMHIAELNKCLFVPMGFVSNRDMGKEIH
jgi:hypothetical protein